LRRTLPAVLVALAIIFTPMAAQDRGEPRVIVISIDGLMPVTYTSPTAPVPNLRKLAAEGAWAEGVIGVLPTVTFPSHTTLITGVEPAEHGIVDNLILDPEGRSGSAWNWYARSIKVATLPMAVRARGLRAAAITWPVTVGMDLDYLVPEFFRSTHPESLTLLRELSHPRGLLEAAELARGKPFGWPQTDRERTDLTKFIISTYDPNILLLHLIELDSAQHANGPGSPQAVETVARLDGYVGEIVDAIKASGRPTHIALVSDHGFLPLTTMLQPNAAFKQEGLLSVDARGVVSSWQAYFRSSGGSGFVYLKDPALGARVQKILMDLKQNPANGIREIWTRADLDARGAQPEAAFGLDVVDGFYTGAGTDVLVKPSTSKGGHGFAPDRPALHASLILTGPSIQRRGNLGLVRMTQIAPTLARILGVSLSPAAGKPLAVDARAEPATR
jgi:predicted AlkP superfamily pyrophosphatase or phosphodiesterase